MSTQSQGEALKIAIRRKGYSQEQAAAKLGVSRQTLTTYLGRYELTANVLKDVNDKLGIDLPPIEAPRTDNPIYTGQTPPTKSEYYEKIIEEKDRTIEQLRDTINALTTAVKSISGNPDTKPVSRSTSGAKTH